MYAVFCEKWKKSKSADDFMDFLCNTNKKNATTYFQKIYSVFLDIIKNKFIT